jgi:hypothetical protein
MDIDRFNFEDALERLKEILELRNGTIDFVSFDLELTGVHVDSNGSGSGNSSSSSST